MSDFEKNPAVIALREKISTLSTKVKEHKANLDRMILESQKWVSYQASLLTLELQIASLEAEKARLEAVKPSWQACFFAIFYGRCKDFEQVAGMKDPFDLSKVKKVIALRIRRSIIRLKKPPSLQRHAPSKTQALVASSPKATPFFVLGSNSMSYPADASIVMPLSSQVE
ncbi:hypothetical protein Tco_0962437 [Tanacetum coccineum]